MDLAVLATEAAAAFGVALTGSAVAGGQKAVLAGKLATGVPVAMLVVRLEGPHVNPAKERAHREVSLLASIDSPYVVKILSDLKELGSPCEGVAWLEELLPGPDLRASLGKKWSWPDARSLAKSLAHGLQAFHEKGVVHRDLSPGNVVRASATHFKIIDPGLARHLEKTTMTGAFQPGTPGFMSPEHVSQGARPTAASDVFCVGLLLYLALSGSNAFEFRGDMAEYASQLRAGTFVPLATLRFDLPDNVVRFVSRCLERQSARRFLDGKELLEGLSSL